METRVSLRFSLRTLLAVVLAITLALGCWAEGARETKWLAAELQRHGVSASYEVHKIRFHHNTISWFNPDYQPPLHERLLLEFRCKWPEFFSHVSSVTLKPGPLPREVRHCLQRLQCLWSLHVSKTDFNDEDVRLLACAATLQHLQCSSTKLTDDGMKHIARFSQLRSLDLTETAVSDVGLAQLAHLGNLERLQIGDWDEDPPGDLPPQHRISYEAVERLKAALPNCSFVGSWRLPRDSSDNDEL